MHTNCLHLLPKRQVQDPFSATQACPDVAIPNDPADLVKKSDMFNKAPDKSPKALLPAPANVLNSGLI